MHDPLNGVLTLDGMKRIEGVTFRNETFAWLYLGGPSDPMTVVSDVQFDHCEIRPGELAIYSNVVLKDVIFDSLKLGGGMAVSSSARLERVVLRGKWSGRIWIGPRKTLQVGCVPRAGSDTSGNRLDVTELFCDELTVLGMSIDDFTFDPERYLDIELVNDEMTAIPENDLVATWMLFMRKMRVTEGLFSVPAKDRAAIYAAVESTMEQGFLRSRAISSRA